MTALISARGLKKIYRRGAETVRAADGISLDVNRGELLAITGPSGSGKTTLLNLLGCLDTPDEGSLSVAGTEIFGSGRKLAEGRLTLLRRRTFGYIFQQFHLVPTLTVLENVLLPRVFYQNGPLRKSPGEILKRLGLEHRAEHLPAQLSGGEMQRAAIARALINGPEAVLADEPTGNLDSTRAEEIKEILSSLAADGIAVIMVTHNPALAGAAGRIIEIRDGRITPSPKP
ncbi:MAG: ABC transporter ATP-binding protein [Elusimicrobiales bacterium]